MLDLDNVVGFDLETTGINPHEDRIVSAALGELEWLVDPGVSIPDGAAAVHGITNVMLAWARRHRLADPPVMFLWHLTAQLEELAQEGTPVVGMNLVYDLTMLGAELRRHAVPVPVALADLQVVDIYVIDKHYDPVRPGRRWLSDLHQHYLGVPLEGAHGAFADARAAVNIWRAQVAAYGLNSPSVGALDYRALHSSQKCWYAEQKEALAAFLGRMGRPFMYDTCWPACPGPAGHNLQTPPALEPVVASPATWDDIPSRERTRT